MCQFCERLLRPNEIGSSKSSLRKSASVLMKYFVYDTSFCWSLLYSQAAYFLSVKEKGLKLLPWLRDHFTAQNTKVTDQVPPTKTKKLGKQQTYFIALLFSWLSSPVAALNNFPRQSSHRNQCWEKQPRVHRASHQIPIHLGSCSTILPNQELDRCGKWILRWKMLLTITPVHS